MSASPVDAFGATLADMDVPCERTTPGEFADTLAPFLDAPAVGVPLAGFDVSLPADDVTVDPTPAALKRAHTGVTPAAFAVADYGSVVVPSSAAGAELVSLFVNRHVAVVDADAVVPDMEAAFERFGASFRAEKQSSVIATGPSATADMGALVTGAHGPEDVVVIVVEGADG